MEGVRNLDSEYEVNGYNANKVNTYSIYYLLYSTTEIYPEIQRFENIKKSANDDRSYRGLKLSNDLNVILISHPETYRAAVSMTIGGGKYDGFNCEQSSGGQWSKLQKSKLFIDFEGSGKRSFSQKRRQQIHAR